MYIICWVLRSAAGTKKSFLVIPFNIFSFYQLPH
jgi:hypothetical protein